MPNPDQDISGFAAKIEEYLTPLDLTLKTLAEDLAIHPSTLGYWIHGDSRKVRRGEKISLSPEKVKLVIAALVRREAIVTVAEALELLALALPDRPRLQKFNSSDQKTDWFRELCANELDGATPYTEHRLPLRTEPKNGKSKVTEDAGIGSKANIAPLPPRSANGLVGREAEIEQLIEMLTYPDSATRLVTLKGMGGIGKTSLGLEVLHRLAEKGNAGSAFPDGITFVPLAEATSTGLLIASMLQAVGMKPAASGSEVSPAEQLANFLASKRMLIMLDNFEQLLATSGGGSGELEENPRLFLSNLLVAAPGLKLLVTSQVRLRIQGEQVFEVGLLGYPALGTAVSVDTVMQEYPAVKLFVEAANRENNNLVNDAFTLTAENVQDVCAICYYLDGIPLAISLAAGRANEFKPDVMLAAFLARGAAIGDVNFANNRHSSMKLLAQGADYLPKRHQKIESTLDWSYEWLTEKERAVFRRLAVFEGGFGLEAVASVCRGVVEAIEAGEIVSNLVSKSLVVPVSSGNEIRYKLLVTMQDYALLQLEKMGELEQVRELHAGWGLELAREAEPHLSAASRAVWQERLKIEYVNLTAALGWLVKKGNAGEALELAAVLGNFAVSAGSNYRSEAKLWLQRALSMGVGVVATGKKGKAKVRPEVRAKAFHQAGRIAVSEKDSWQAQSYFEKAVELWQQIDNPKGLCLSLLGLGNIAFADINYDLATDFYSQAEQAARKTEDKQSLSASLNNLASVAFAKEDYSEAKTRFEEVYIIKREINDKSHIAIILKNLAVIEIRQNNLEKARLLSQQSFSLNESLGRKAENTSNLYNFGEIEQLKGNLILAQEYFFEGLKLSVETSNYRYVPALLNKTATILIQLKNDYQEAAEIYGIVEKNMEIQSDLFDSTDRLEYNTGVSLLEQNLSKETTKPRWLEGRDIGTDLRKAALLALSLLAPNT